MANVLEFTNLGTPPNENPSTFPYFGNVVPPYMATLSLPGFTIGLPIWLFSTSIFPPQPNASPQQNSPSQHHQPSIDPLPSSPNFSSSVSSSSLGKSLDDSNQVSKKKKKGKKKNKKKK